MANKGDLPPVMRRPGRIIRVSDEPVNLSRAPGPKGPGGRAEADFLETGSAGASTILIPGGPTAPWRSFINVNTEDRKSIPITVTLSSYLLGNSTIAIGATRGSLDAKVSWGAGGGSAEAIIDFMNGAAFTLVCSSLALDIRNTYPDPGFNQNVFNLSAFISKGPKGSGVTPQRTVQAFGVTTGTQNIPAADQSLPVAIPQFAKEGMFARGINGPIGVTDVPAMYIEYRDGNGNPIQSLYIGNNELCPWIPIPNGAVDARVKNIGAVTATTCQFIFDLAI